MHSGVYRLIQISNVKEVAINCLSGQLNDVAMIDNFYLH